MSHGTSQTLLHTICSDNKNTLFFRRLYSPTLRDTDLKSQSAHLLLLPAIGIYVHRKAAHGSHQTISDSPARDQASF